MLDHGFAEANVSHDLVRARLFHQFALTDELSVGLGIDDRANLSDLTDTLRAAFGFARIAALARTMATLAVFPPGAFPHGYRVKFFDYF